MATVDTTVETPVDPDTRLSARIVRFLAKTPLHIVLALIAIFWLIPTTGLFITSILTPSDAAEGHWWTFVTKPSTWTLENYANMFDNEGITHALWVTVLVTIGATIVPILVAALAAYALAWIEFPGRDWLFLLVVGLLLVPIQMALIPIFRLYNNLNLFDTIPGLILFHSAFALPFAIFLLRNFFVGIPRDLMEAARIDGASEWGLFFKVVLPLGLPAIASLAIFQVLFVWNDLLVGLVLAQQNQPIAPDDRVAAAPVRLQPRRARACLVLLGAHPADNLRALPALLRPGPARRLRQVDRDVGAGRDRRLRARRLRRLHDPAPRGPAAGRDRRLRQRRRPGRRLAAARGGDPAAADALRERRPLRPHLVPGTGRARGRAAARPGSARAERPRPLPADRGGVPPPRRRAARAQPLGRELRARPDRPDRGRRRRIRGRPPRRLPARARRHGPPGPRRPGRARGRSAGRPRLRAARVRLTRRRRRRRHGCGDRVAERARGRLRGRLGAPPGAGQAAAQRRPAVLQQARPRRLLRRAAQRGAPSSSAASASRRIRPAAPGTPPSRRPSARAASASRPRSTAPSR